MVHPVSPVQLLQFINSYNPKGLKGNSDSEVEMETEHAFLTYEKMSSDQQELVDEVLEEHEDFDEDLAVQCINELRNEACLGNDDSNLDNIN